MTQAERVLAYLKKYGSITSLEMFDNFYICCPTATIRDLRKRLGYENITDIWQTKKRKEIKPDGKEHTVTVKYKRYFLETMGEETFFKRYGVNKNDLVFSRKKWREGYYG